MKEHNLEAFYKYYSNTTKEQAIEDMYMDNCKLTEENEYLRFIIKEVRETLNTQLAFTSSYRLNYQSAMNIIEEAKSILYKVDKENKEWN